MAKKEKNIVFVCTGNTCRSPMAEYMAKDIAKEKGRTINFSSRGLAVNSSPISKEACQVVSELYPLSDIYQHKPQSFGFFDYFRNNLVLTMTNSHKQKLLEGIKRPFFRGKVFTLREYTGLADLEDVTGLDIADPFSAGEWPKSYLVENDLEDYLSDEAYEVKLSNHIWVIDPVVRMRAYSECRDQIGKCLEELFRK